MDDVREIVRENPRGMSNSIRSRLKRIFQNALHTATTWSCGRADDVVLRQYNLPEAFSSRPSEARASQGFPTRSASMRENVCIFTSKPVPCQLFIIWFSSQTRTPQDATLLRTSSRTIVEPDRPGSSRQPPHVSLIIIVPHVYYTNQMLTYVPFFRLTFVQCNNQHLEDHFRILLEDYSRRHR